MESKHNIAEGSNAKDNAQKASKKSESVKDPQNVSSEEANKYHKIVLELEKTLDNIDKKGTRVYFKEAELEAIGDGLRLGCIAENEIQQKDYARVAAKIEQVDLEQLNKRMKETHEYMKGLIQTHEWVEEISESVRKREESRSNPKTARCKFWRFKRWFCCLWLQMIWYEGSPSGSMCSYDSHGESFVEGRSTAIP